MADAKIDGNSTHSLIGASSIDGTTPTVVFVNPNTHRMLVDLPGGTGTVTSVSVVSANGFAGSVATATTTPAITLSTTVTGLLKGNGTAISAATAGTDYMAPGVDTVGNLQFVDATYDIGATASSRPRNGYFSSGLAIGSATASSGVANVGVGFRIANAASSGKILRANGTNFIASTATYPDTGGTSGNVLTSDGTNWNSSAPTVAIATQVTGLGSNVATFLATPSSANLAAAVTGETGTGALVFGTSPDFTTAVTLGGVAIPTISSTNTLTNKRITRRLVTVNAPGATPSTNTDNTDVANFTGLATAITSMTTNLSGTPVDGDLLEFRFLDNGTARGITWGASFAATTVALPTTTVLSTVLRVLFEWSGSTWNCLATA